jgi:hypothetical protein
MREVTANTIGKKPAVYSLISRARMPAVRGISPFRSEIGSRDRVELLCCRSAYWMIDGLAACFGSESRSTARWRTVTAWLRSLADIASRSISSLSVP